MSDEFYDYSQFSEERIREIFEGWDGLGGYHGLLIKRCSRLLVGKTVLDVGCGLCHLYSALRSDWVGKHCSEYVGVDVASFILGMAKKRFPNLNLVEADVYDLSKLSIFDTVFAIGLYRGEPVLKKGISELFKHTNRCLVLTYFPKEKGVVPSSLKIECATHEFIDHDIDPRLEIMRVWRIK